MMPNLTPITQSLKRQARWLPLVAALLSACSAVPTASPQEQLRQRVTERWQALIAADYAKAYSYSTPAYRTLVTPEAYRGRQGTAVQRVAADVFSVDCPEPTHCKVRVVVKAKPPFGKAFDGLISAPVDEAWVLEDGQWWVVLAP